MVRGNQEGRQVSSWEPAVLDCERAVQLPGGIRPKQAVGHSSRGPRLERVQAGLRDTSPVHKFHALGLYLRFLVRIDEIRM